ncbi:hypothetical protein PI124_g16914 [Phytophthora idaei]|nr:hypothetical protein PI125_g17204 [Phytophthora idaei]KAG3140340.1 hypothetical protein PI126_g16062 [Phytophthora idaei]KAG3238120.1 hypothetical protein PI124_g16914 [Phytophthora idaei]
MAPRFANFSEAGSPRGVLADRDGLDEIGWRHIHIASWGYHLPVAMGMEREEQVMLGKYWTYNCCADHTNAD